jgi:hypothetical protein
MEVLYDYSPAPADKNLLQLKVKQLFGSLTKIYLKFFKYVFLNFKIAAE